MMACQYECDQCGACCRGTLIVEAYCLDALREPRILGANVSGRDVPLEELNDEWRCVVIAAGSPCRFLGDDGRCTIYPTRPNTCVAFEVGNKQCQEARSQLGLPLLETLRRSQSQSQNAPRV